MQIPIERVYGLYDDGWSQAELVPSAFQHPAKFSKKLVYWIIRTGLKRKWWDKGSTLLDPFGGVGLGGVVASSLKLNWIGVELEPRFVKIANGCDCDGFSAMEYRRYLGKPRSARLLAASWRPDLCPDCHARALTPAREDKLLMPLKKRYNKYYPVREAHPPDASPALTPAREIPRQKPHHFTGNFDLYRAAWRLLGAPEPVMLQGDSRFLAKALAQLTAGPSENAQETALRDSGHVHAPEPEKLAQNRHLQAQGAIQAAGPAQPDGAITIPPYAELNIAKNDSRAYHVRHDADYGSSEGQLGAMPSGALTSPPFLGVVGAQSDAEDYAARGFKIGVMAGAKYGTSEGQLGVMAPGATVDAAITSPPYGNRVDDHGVDQPGYEGMSEALGDYGRSDGQVGKMRITAAPDEPGEVSGALTSPPYAGLQADMAGHGIIGAGVSHGAYNDAHYGTTEGQIGNMHAAPADGVVTSPPISPPGNQGSTRQGTHHDLELQGRSPTDHQQGATAGNVAALPLQDTLPTAQELDINTYWGACTEIYKQVYEVLPPGGHMAMVVKGFIRAGAYVDLPKITMNLLISIGWLPITYIEAMQVSEHEQLSLMPGMDTSTQDKQGKPLRNKRSTRKSFFRLMAEEKGSPAIDAEWVLVVKKPA